MTAGNVANPADADVAIEGSDYEPGSKWTLGSFRIFAIPLVFISVSAAIFSTYGGVLNTAGPGGRLAVCLLGQTLVAFVVAQIAARIALIGSSYQWASRLANSKIGWMFGAETHRMNANAR
jgi:amino acid transporter